MNGAASHVSLTSRWSMRAGCEADAVAAVTVLAERVRAEEPGTLMYLVHTPRRGDGLQSLPPSPEGLLLFFELYSDAQAFERHVSGPAFTQFVRDHAKLFVPAADGRPYTTVEFLSQRAGFVRQDGAQRSLQSAAGGHGALLPANRHPAVMFEIIARDQDRALSFYAKVFGFSYRAGTGGFAYVDFPSCERALLGGVGQSSGEPGFEPGHNFYLQVDDLEATIAAAVAAGGSLYMPITSVDGYRFAMIRDPEANPIGLIEPFGA